MARIKFLPVLLAAVWMCSGHAQEWYAGPDGAASNAGTSAAPWDIASALGGAKKVAPGDTVWLKAGTYKYPNRDANSYGYAVKLAGTKDNPIVVRGESGKRVTIDGGLHVEDPSAGVWIRDLEVTLSEQTSEIKTPGSGAPKELNRPWGGVEVRGGRDCKFINLVISNNAQGMGLWSGALDCEVYGCIFYDNGWKAPDRGHGHCIYTQNKDGVKTISSCIMQARFDGAYTMHAYGSARADCDHYLITENIAYMRGPFLVGSGKPSHDIKVFRNVLFGVSMQIGYNAPFNEDCEVRGNAIFNGGLAINKYKNAVNENNLIVPKLDAKHESKVFFFPNKYDPQRAHLAVLNPAKAPQVSVKMEGFAKAGDKIALYDPKNFYGDPLWEGTAAGAELAVPVAGEFNVYVVRKR